MTRSLVLENLKKVIKIYPNFPKEGINFVDVMPLFQDYRLLQQVIDEMFFNDYTNQHNSKVFRNKKIIDKVVGMEARGFLFGSLVAMFLGCGFVPLRKPGKLPGLTKKIQYALEYKENESLEIQSESIKKDDRVLIVDDILATGGTLNSAIHLVEACGGVIVGVSVLGEIKECEGRKKIFTNNSKREFPLTSLLSF